MGVRFQGLHGVTRSWWLKHRGDQEGVKVT